MKPKTNLLAVFLITSVVVASSCTPSAIAVKRSIELPTECSRLRQPQVSFTQSLNNPDRYCVDKEEVIGLYGYFRMNNECDRIVEDLLK